MSKEGSILFATVLQQYWSIVVSGLIVDFEERWLQQFKRLEQKSGGPLSIDQFLCSMHYCRRKVYDANSLDDIPFDSWCWPAFLPYYDLVTCSLPIASIFQTLADCIISEAGKTQNALENVGNSCRFYLKLPDSADDMRRYWKMLSEGTNQYVSTVSFAIFLESLLELREVPIRWSLRDDQWHVKRCYVIDGVAINAEQCIPDCTRSKRFRNAQTGRLYSETRPCDQLECWRRPHMWLLIVLKHSKTQETRLVNFDITPALFKKNEKSRSIGCIPVNCGFKPFIWAKDLKSVGADYKRDEAPFVERSGPAGKLDEETWNCLSNGCTHLTDEEVFAKRDKNESFYAVAAAHRVYHTRQLSVQVHTDQKLMIYDLKRSKIPAAPTCTQENAFTFLHSITRADLVQQKLPRAATLMQMLIMARGVSHLLQVLANSSR